jgi:hypothetical protein
MPFQGRVSYVLRRQPVWSQRKEERLFELLRCAAFYITSRYAIPIPDWETLFHRKKYRRRILLVSEPEGTRGGRFDERWNRIRQGLRPPLKSEAPEFNKSSRLRKLSLPSRNRLNHWPASFNFRVSWVDEANEANAAWGVRHIDFVHASFEPWAGRKEHGVLVGGCINRAEAIEDSGVEM